jgi:hypothetical protein
MATSPPTRQFFFRSRVMRRRKARSSRNQLGHYSSINTRTPPAQRVRSSASTCHSFAWSEGFTSCATGYFRSSRPDFRSRIWGQMAWRITKRTSPASRVAPLAPPPAGVTTGAEAAARRPRHRISPAWGGVAARRGGSPLRSNKSVRPRVADISAFVGVTLLTLLTVRHRMGVRPHLSFHMAVTTDTADTIDTRWALHAVRSGARRKTCQHCQHCHECGRYADCVSPSAHGPPPLRQHQSRT